ncbi:MAG: F0F1 ATP synthase subunit gamma [Telmatospirillum sp.]|nr:F0F1 ATP synthase subunit gamma [Telmatospirillum sp.]
MSEARDPVLRIAGLRRFREIAAALRAIAANALHAADSGRAAARAYEAEVAAAVRQILGPLPMPRPRIATVAAFVAEAGFCGAFDETVLREARRQAAQGVRLVLVGRRGARRAREANIPFDAVLPMAAHVAGFGDCAANVLAELAARGPLALVACRSRPQGADLVRRIVGARDAAEATTRRARPLALMQEPFSTLAAALEREADYAAVHLCVAESFAVENAARFARMDAACRRADDEIERLARRIDSLRQDRISQDIFETFGAAGPGDVATAAKKRVRAEAVSSPRP